MSVIINNDSGTGTVELKGQEVAGNIVATLPEFSCELAPRMQLMQVQLTTSGTFKDFTGLPSWAKKITVMFNGVSTSGTSPIQIQMGTIGGIAVTGYHAEGAYGSSSGQYVISTTAFPIEAVNSATANTVRYGSAIFTTMGANTWSENLTMFCDVIQTFCHGSGVVTLSGVLDRIRITTVNGTDTFDAGQVNILVEG